MGTVEGKKQEKRRALLEAAYDLFLERGAAKTEGTEPETVSPESGQEDSK